MNPSQSLAPADRGPGFGDTHEVAAALGSKISPFGKDQVFDAATPSIEDFKFGEQVVSDFDDYCRRVHRLLPKLGGLGATMSSMSFNWRRLISAEYNSAFIWLIACFASVLQNIGLTGNYSTVDCLVMVLWSAIGLTITGYLIARILKKTGRLRPPELQMAAE